MFSSEICEISKNTFFTEHLWTIAFIACIHEHYFLKNKAITILSNFVNNYFQFILAFQGNIIHSNFKSQ